MSTLTTQQRTRNRILFFLIGTILLASSIYGIYYFATKKPGTDTDSAGKLCITSQGCQIGEICREGKCDISQPMKVAAVEGDEIAILCDEGEKYEILGPVSLRPVGGKLCPTKAEGVEGSAIITTAFQSLLRDPTDRRRLAFKSRIPDGVADPCPYHLKEIAFDVRCTRV